MTKRLYKPQILAWVIFGVLAVLLLLAPLPMFLKNRAHVAPPPASAAPATHQKGQPSER